MRSKQKQARSSTIRHPQSSGESILNRKIVAPQKLKILVLAGNQLLNQHLDFLGKCVNLIKLDLSHNHITKLSEKHSLAALQKLEVIFLNNNKIATIQAFHPLYVCNNIVHLTYHHNPLEVHVKNQHQLVNSLTSLKLINSRVVYVQERADFIMHERPPFVAKTEILQSWKSNQNSQAYYLKVLNMQLQYIDNIWTFNNPIIIIQRAWRHFLPQNQVINSAPSSHHTRSIRTKLTDRKKGSRGRNQSGFGLRTTHPLKQWFSEWKQFSFGLKAVRQAMKKCKVNNKNTDKSYMLLQLDDYNRELRNMKVTLPVKQFIQKIRRIIYERKMGYRLKWNLVLKMTLFGRQQSFYNLSGIKEHNRIFYNKNQQHIFDNFLAIIAEKFNKQDVIANHCTFEVAKQYSAIRLVDPQSFFNKYRGKTVKSICSLLWPSMKVVICNKKKVASKFKPGGIGIPQLSYIKNRNKVISKVELKKVNETYKRIQKFAANQYQNSLWCISCQDETVMRQLIRMVYYHNCAETRFQVKKKRNQMLSLLQNYEEPIIVYVDEVLKRTAAAVAIQKSWRRYISNKNQVETIYQKMRKNRAAMHIQSFIRNIRYHHRSSFSKKLTCDLALLKTRTIMYPLTFYMNISRMFRQRLTSKLFSKIKVMRQGPKIGMCEQYYRPIFQKKIREKYFKDQKIGMQSYQSQIGLYNLFHYDVLISIVVKNGIKFIALSYPSQTEANITASIVALISYQMYGFKYVWPMSKQHPEKWEQRISQSLQIKAIKPFLQNFYKQTQSSGANFSKQVQEHGLFLWRSQKKQFQQSRQLKKGTITVQFYQKRFHNFPVKHQQTLFYTVFNQKLQQPVVEDSKIRQKQKLIKIQQSKESIKSQPQQGPLSITMIDRRRISFFDQSQKTFKANDDKLVASMGRTMGPLLEQKKQKVLNFYKEQFLRRQAQKQIKQTSLAAIRQKSKQQKILNKTMKGFKELQRTEALRSKVQQIKDFKQRAINKRSQQDFVQQNNFVMQQQLKMVIMRGKIKQGQNRRQSFLAKKSIEKNSEHPTSSIPSRKSSRQKNRFDQEDRAAETGNNEAVGEEGSVINVKKRIKKPRAQSIGAYIRDPSFVHGVFPQEYYPIQSRATSFYFPPVV